MSRNESDPSNNQPTNLIEGESKKPQLKFGEIVEFGRPFEFRAGPYNFQFKEVKWKQYPDWEAENAWIVTSITWADGRPNPLPGYLQDYLEHPEVYDRNEYQDEEHIAQATRDMIVRYENAS